MIGKLLKVSGNSLLPTYKDGDFVLVSKIPYLFGKMKTGDVIAFRQAVYGTLLKVVDDLTPDGDQITVVGTYPGSIDSSTFGPIGRGDVIGKVIWHIKRPLSA